MKSTKIKRGDYLFWVFSAPWGYEVVKALDKPNSIPVKIAPEGDGHYKTKATAMKHLKELAKY